jgi:dipeptidyl aminopeptidase/acylaminoacyl peptidase
MQGTRHIFGLFMALVACLATAVLTTLAAGQTDRITRPAVSEKASPLQPIAPVAHDGYRGYGFLRKPPGDGPFPAVVLIHGGLNTWASERLRQFVITSAMPSRLLAAGYVVATMTYRSRDVDPQSRVSLDDSLAAVEYLQRLPYVNAASVAVYGCSGGGDLALAVASEKRVAAIVAEEPASIMFTGVWNSSSPKAGERYDTGDSAPIFENPKRYYTEEHQRLTKQKIARIQSPILIAQGDVKTLLAVNDFNAAVLIPELRSAGKVLEVVTYPGEPHCFAFGDYGPPSSSASTVKAFHDIDAFIRRHIVTRPKAVDPSLVTQTPFTFSEVINRMPANNALHQTAATHSWSAAGERER